MANYRSKRQARRAPKSGRHKTSHPSAAWPWLLSGMFVGILCAMATYMISTGKWNLPISKKTPLLSTEINNEVAKGKLKSKASSATSPAAHKTPEITQRFEFYHLLPGMEVPIPDTEPSNITPAKAVAVAPKPVTPISAAPQRTTVATTPITPIAPVAPKLKKPERSAALLGTAATPPIQSKTTSLNTNLPQVQRKLAAAQYLIQVSAFRTANQAEELKSRLVLQGFKPHIQKVRVQDDIWFRVTLGPFSTETMALKQKKQLEKHQIRGILFLQR
jgi:cell division protein FtsN